MKFQINAKCLATALAASCKIADKRGHSPVLTMIKVTARASCIELTATDLDVCQTVRVPADVQTQGVTLLPAHSLLAFVKSLPVSGTMQLETVETEKDYHGAAQRDGAALHMSDGKWRFAGKHKAECSDSETSGEAAKKYCELANIGPDSKGVATVSCGSARLNLNYGAIGDWPEFKGLPMDCAAFELAAPDFLNALDRTTFAISSEETRYYLNGIFLHVTEGLLRLVATDGHRMAIADLPAPAIEGMFPAVIVPRLAVENLNRLLKKVTAPVRVAISGPQSTWTIEARDGTVTTFETKHIDGTFPDYSRVVPSANDKFATIDRAAFSDAVKRISSGLRGSQSRGSALKLLFSQGELKISRTNADIGNASESLPCDFDAFPLEIGFNAMYLADAIEATDGQDVLLSLYDPGSPTLIAARRGASNRSVLMPMRI
jgi:DNA polymerase-3 subunit beta